jgi:hypothetical protein
MRDEDVTVEAIDRLISERDDYKDRWLILGRVAKRMLDKQEAELESMRLQLTQAEERVAKMQAALRWGKKK